MKKTVHYLGMYWEESALRLTDVVLTSNKAAIQKTVTAPWPATGFASFSLAPADVANFVKQQIDIHAWAGRSILLALPRHRYFAHKLADDEMNEKNLASLAQKWFPHRIDELIWQMDPTQQTLIAISKSWEKNLTQAFSAQGIPLIAITTTSSVGTDIVGAYLEERGVWLANKRHNHLLRWQQLTKRYANALAATSLGLVVAGVALSSRVDDNRLQLAALTHRSYANIAGPKTNAAKQLSAEQMLLIWNQVPVHCYLTDFSFDAQQSALNLHGRAADYAVVTSFADALSQLPGVKKIENEKLSLIDIDHHSIVDFSLTVPL